MSFIPRDRERLDDILSAADDLIAFSSGLGPEGFAANKTARYAILHCLTIIGEAANQLSEEVRNQHAAVPWRRVIAFRHRIVHGYGDLDLVLPWELVEKMVPALRAQVGEIRAGLRDDESEESRA